MMNKIRNYKRYDPEVKLSYKEAVDLGVNTYWTGVACSNGHLDHRYVCNRKCVKCEFDRHRKHRSKAFTDEALQVGINPDVRRRIAEMKILKEYSIDL